MWGQVHSSKRPEIERASVFPPRDRRFDELKQTMAKDAALRQQQRKIDQLYAKLAAGSTSVGQSEMSLLHEEGVVG